MTSPGEPRPGGHRYLSGHIRDGELARLRAIESVCDRWTTGVLERFGSLAGWRCLDAGAGAGSVARWLARQTGPAGQVMAADLDTRFLEPLPPLRCA